MLINILILFGITLIPAFELRASIPYGILGGSLELPFGIVVQGLGEPWLWVFLVCVISNMILGTILYPLINHIMLLLERIPFINKLWNKFVVRAQKKIHPYVEKWGIIGVALFIAVPLPGSGSYTGVLGAYLLGISYKRVILANAIGVTLAGIAVTILTLFGISFFQL
ncbi:MAG: small multi-drug export protein [Pseudomonadota bacterium]